ncbi:MAG: PAS domain S-box protein, partial [Thermoplasmata archaeon]
MKDLEKTEKKHNKEINKREKEITQQQKTKSGHGERKSAQSESEARYKSFIENFHGIAYRAGENWTPEFFHGAVEEITGYTEDELRAGNPSWDKIIHPEDFQAILNEDEKKLHTHIDHSFEREYRIIRKDGEIRWIREYIKSASLEPLKLEGALYDITEHKKSLEALQASEERYRRLIELSYDGVIIHRGGKIVYINTTGANLMGASDPGEILGKQIIDFVHPDYKDLVNERLKKVQEEGIPARSVEEKFFRLDGTVIDVEVIGIPITYQGEPAMQVVFRDITSRKKTEEALRESEAKYSALVEHAKDGVFIVQDGKILFINKAISYLGYTPEELIGKPFVDFVPEDHKKLLYERYRMRMEGKKVPSRYETKVLHKDGSIKDIEVSTGTIQYNGKPADMGIVRDITERKRTEAALHESEERYRRVNENIQDVIFSLDPEGNITFISGACENLFGIPADELIGNNLFQAAERVNVSRETLEAMVEQYRETIERRGETARYELAFEKEFETQVLELNERLIYDDKGNPLEGVGVIRDITER